MRFRGVLIFFLLLLPYLVELQESSVWDSNEAFYIQTPREMAARGDWVVPYFNQQPRLNKPPLSYWLVGLSQSIIPNPVLAERAVLALVAAGCLLGCWRLARLLLDDPNLALLALGLFATCFRFLVLSRRLLIDTLLLCCLIAATVAFCRWLQSGRRGPFLLMTAALALGFLAKGPVVGLTVLSFISYLVLTGLWRSLKPADLGWALLLSATICLPWYLLLARQLGFDVLFNFFFRENIGRFTHLDFGPTRGVFFYVGVLAADFAPWSLLLVGSLPWGWRELKREWKGRSTFQLGRGTVPAPVLLLAIWIALWVVVFSLSRNKQEYYILPVYPLAACWIAGWLGRAQVSLFWRLLPGLPVLGAAAVLAALGVSQLGASFAVWLLVLFCLPFGYLCFARRWLGASVVLSIFFTTSLLFFTEPLEHYRPIRHFASTIQSQASSQARVGYYRLASPSLAVYLDRHIDELYTTEDARALLGQEAEVWLVVEEKDFTALQGLSPGRPLETLERRPLLTTRLVDILRRLGNSESSEIQRFALLVRAGPKSSSGSPE